MATVQIVQGTSYTPFSSQTASSGVYILDAVGYNNSSGSMTAMDLQIIATSFTPAAGGVIAIYLIPELDGSNYANHW